MKIILEITKKECFELQKLGHKFGNECSLHKSKSRHPKYYIVERGKAEADLKKIRESKIVETFS